MGGRIAGANARANSAELGKTNYSWKIHKILIENSKFVKRKNLKFEI